MQTQYQNMGENCEGIRSQGKGFHYSQKLIKVVAIYETVRLTISKKSLIKSYRLGNSALLKK